MPLAKYFFVVGGILLALLLVSNAVLPDFPVAEKPDGNKPVIRISSDRKWPERVVFDTNLPTIVPPASRQAQLAAPAQAVAGSSGSASTRDAFAQMSAKDAHQLASIEAKSPDPKLERKRRIAKRRVAPPMMVVEQQPRFGFGLFGNNIW
jgi:hypothetical protein